MTTTIDESIELQFPNANSKDWNPKTARKPTLYQIKCPNPPALQENLKPSRRYFLKETHLGVLDKSCSTWAHPPWNRNRNTGGDAKTVTQPCRQNKNMATIKHIPLTTNMSTLQRSIYNNPLCNIYIYMCVIINMHTSILEQL